MWILLALGLTCLPDLPDWPHLTFKARRALARTLMEAGDYDRAAQAHEALICHADTNEPVPVLRFVIRMDFIDQCVLRHPACGRTETMRRHLAEARALARTIETPARGRKSYEAALALLPRAEAALSPPTEPPPIAPPTTAPPTAPPAPPPTAPPLAPPTAPPPAEWPFWTTLLAGTAGTLVLGGLALADAFEVDDHNAAAQAAAARGHRANREAALDEARGARNRALGLGIAAVLLAGATGWLAVELRPSVASIPGGFVVGFTFTP